MRRTMITLLAFLLVAALAAPASANDWRLRLFGAWTDTGVDASLINDQGVPIAVESSSEVGLGGSIAYQFHRLWAVEAGFISVDPGISLRAQVPGFGALDVEDSLGTGILTLDLDVLLTPDSESFDLFVGAGVANLSYGSLSYSIGMGDDLALRVENDTTWTVKAAFDWALGEGGWGITGGLRYVDGELEVSERDDPRDDSRSFDSDLLVGTLGISYSF